MKIFDKDAEPFLLLAGVLSAVAALLHIAIIVGGPTWYRLLGTGTAMESMVESGSITPAITTFLIALVLSGWAIYAFSGAGIIRRLPYLRPALVTIAVLYLVRGLLIVPAYVFVPEVVDGYLQWTSLAVTLFGLSYAIGIGRSWKALGDRRKGERRQRERFY